MRTHIDAQRSGTLMVFQVVHILYVYTLMRRD